ncbi:MAG: hypothetical protein AAGC95_07665 [Pseudomonadota bacterium]
MGSVSALLMTAALATGAVAVYKYFKSDAFQRRVDLAKARAAKGGEARQVIDLKQDPEDGVFREDA